MRERSEMILKIVCLALAALLLVQLVRVGLRVSPLGRANIPPLPTLPDASNEVAVVRGTNAPGSPATAVKGTNRLQHAEGTNAAPAAKAAGTNATRTLAVAEPGTNTPSPGKLTESQTNSALRDKSGKNRPTPGPAADMAASGTNLNPRALAARKAPELPPAIQARVSRITDSEILGQVMRPLPMALLGIAGEFAFLRAPSGQTGLVKEGDSLGELRLLRIGINRVLVEQDGEKKELTIFSGFGGESLLPKPTGDSHETTNKQSNSRK